MTKLHLLSLVGIVTIVAFSVLLSASAAPSAKILQHRGYLDSSGVYHVVGEIKNIGDRPLGFVTVSVVFYDEKGVTVASGKVFTSVLVLLPNEVVPFDATKIDRNATSGIRSYDLHATAQVVKPKPQLLQITSSISYVDSIGFYHVIGKVANDGDRQSTFTNVVGTFYDKEGHIITVGRGLTEPINIPAGQSASFKINIHRDLVQQISAYSLDAESDEFLATGIKG